MFPLLNWPIYSGWTWNTPVVPNMYWNAYTHEQRIKNLWLNMGREEAYLDGMSERINEWADEVTTKINEFETYASELNMDDVKRAKNNGFFTPRFIGRLATTDYKAYGEDEIDVINTQSMCMLDDETVLYATTNSVNTNYTVIVKINIRTNKVVDEYETPFSHCNGMCYNEKNGKLYVPPAGDYSTSPVTSTPYMYVCDPETMTIERTVDLTETLSDKGIHSVCYDKVTGKMYLTSYTSGTPATIRLFAFDYENDTAEFLCTIPTNIKANYEAISQNKITGGTQNIHAYNGELYYLISGENTITILNINESGDILSIIGVERDMFIYSILEAQGMDFTANGDMILCGRAKTRGNSGRYGVIFGINNNAGMLVNTKALNTWNYNAYEIHVDANNDRFKTIYPDGTADNPFPTLDEALACCGLNVGSRIYIDAQDTTTDYYITAINSFEIQKHLFIYVGTNNVIHLNGTSAMTIHNPLSIQGGTWTRDTDSTYMFNVFETDFKMYYGTLDVTHCTNCGLYCTDSTVQMSHVSVTNPNDVDVVNGRGNTYGFTPDSPDVKVNGTLLLNGKYIGLIGDSYSAYSQNNPKWTQKVSDKGWSFANYAVAGTGFVTKETSSKKTFVEQAQQLVNDEHWNNMEYVIIYGGLNDFTHGPEWDGVPATAAQMRAAFDDIATIFNNAPKRLDGGKPKVLVVFGNVGSPRRTVYKGFLDWYEECHAAMKRPSSSDGSLEMAVVDYVPYWLVALPNFSEGYFISNDLTHPSADGYSIIAQFMLDILNGSYTGVHRSYVFGDSYIVQDKFETQNTGNILHWTFDNGIVSLNLKLKSTNFKAYEQTSASATNAITTALGVSPAIGEYDSSTDPVYISGYANGSKIANGNFEYVGWYYNMYNSMLYLRISNRDTTNNTEKFGPGDAVLVGRCAL